MNILAIETTGAFASVAFAHQSGSARKAEIPYESGKAGVDIISKVSGHDRFSHLQNLTPQIQQVIAEAGQKSGEVELSIRDVDLIAVSKGPGSFTGIRIGVSTARALCQALDIPCVGVSSLEALAMRMAGSIYDGDDTDRGARPAELGADNECWSADTESSGEQLRPQALICPILDARRSQVYGGGYYIENGFPVEKIKAGPYTLDEFLEAVRVFENIVFLGDGVDKYGEEIKLARAGRAAFAPETLRYQEAAEVARLGWKKQADGQAVNFDELKPEYMRMAEAERKLKEARQAAGKKNEGNEGKQDR